MLKQEMNLLHVKHILLLVLLLCLPWHGYAKKKPAAVQLTAEDQARFRYYFYEAERLYLNEQFADAALLFRFCLMLNEEDPMVNQFMGDLANAYRLSASALPYYERSYRADPKNERILERLAYTYTDTGNYKQALRMCDLLDQRDGYDMNAAWRRYTVHLKCGHPKQARKALEDYLALDPTYMPFLLARLTLMETYGAKEKDMLAAYEQILSLDENNYVVQNNYAYFLATHKGDLKLAEQLSYSSLQADPRNPIFLDTYAWILYLQGEKQLATLYIRQAVQLSEQGVPDEVKQHYQTITGTEL